MIKLRNRCVEIDPDFDYAVACGLCRGEIMNTLIYFTRETNYLASLQPEIFKGGGGNYICNSPPP